ncbi:heme-binding protein [Luteolibacter arcticus]|uniref:Heme-binding protein n=1 Tax=Luteolibacter arcticus TaxID=1581411 RepID=A0ABT3GNW4_9BACT|nr:heme-binding protein [Luteolibacter arcticus]MCW1925179.1 heme-binding protein [Luteolibacter arcticus]
MTQSEVETVLAQGVQASSVTSTGDRVIAVVDREGHTLAVWFADVGATSTISEKTLAVTVGAAVSRAGTAAYLSSNQNAFTTRTAGFIIQQNFPPGVANRPNGPLVGVGFSNLSFTDTNTFKAPEVGGSFPLPAVPGINAAQDIRSARPAKEFRSVPYVSLAGDPGGVPLFKEGVLIGGIGVAGFNEVPLEDFEIAFAPSVREQIALSGQAGFRPNPLFAGSNVLIDGIRLAYQVGNGSSSTILNPADYLMNVAAGHAVVLTDIDGVAGTLDDGPVDYSPKGSPVPVTYPNPFGLTDRNGIPGELRTAIRADPMGGMIHSEARLSAAEVQSILRLAVERSKITRAGIRLPRGQVARVWITVVGNPNSPGIEPPVLGTYRTPEATFFSWDVSIQKARTAIFFSRGRERGEPRAFSCRSVGFLAQTMYPPGIVGTAAGPLEGLQKLLSTPTGNDPFEPPNYNVPNGITIFPGGFPLYRNGVLIGAIGVSGDGIEQDDIIAASGARDFLPPPAARADNMVYERARIPYARFPRVASGF